MSQFTPQQVIEERNKRLMAWVADELGLNGQKRQQLYAEMRLVFRNATDSQLAKYLWEKLAPKNAEAAKNALKRFQDIAHDWFSNTADDRRS